MHKAEIIGLERTIRLTRSAWLRQAAQALGFQDAVDRVAVEVGQEVGDHKGQVIQRKAGGATQGTDNSPFFVRGFPGQLVRAAGVVLAVGSPALAPFADRLGRHPIALGQYTRGLGGAGDFGPDRWGSAGIGMDRGHQDLLGREGLVHWSKRQANPSIAQRTRSQECSATKHLATSPARSIGSMYVSPAKSLTVA